MRIFFPQCIWKYDACGGWPPMTRIPLSVFSFYFSHLPICCSPSFCSQEWRISIAVELTGNVALLGQQRGSTPATLTSECIAEPLPENTGSILMTSPTPTLFFSLKRRGSLWTYIEKKKRAKRGWLTVRAGSDRHTYKKRRNIAAHCLLFSAIVLLLFSYICGAKGLSYL